MVGNDIKMKENIEGQRIYNLSKRLFPIYRHLTGDGVRETLSLIDDYIANGESGISLEIIEIPSGTRVFDWTVPREWMIENGYVEDKDGNRIIDIKNNNLHVVAYSTAIDKWVDLDELKKHIYSLPSQPEVIPYVTSYYKDMWGFCMSDKMKNSLSPGKYHAVIESRHFDGSLTYGEIVIPGKEKNEIFFSTYICHPSMANNECSGPSLAAELIRYVYGLPSRRYTYRFIFIPETIGSISYLATKDHLQWMKKSMKCGFNLTCVGDDRTYSMVKTRYGNTYADKVLQNVITSTCGANCNIYSFLDRGSDERQYCAPGVDLPVVGFSRSMFHKYPEYHTSADDLGIISPSGFQGSFDVITNAINCIENDYYYKTSVFCEPQLGKRDLYPNVSRKNSSDGVLKMSNFLAYADGKNDIFDISEIVGVPANEIIEMAELLSSEGLVSRTENVIQ